MKSILEIVAISRANISLNQLRALVAVADDGGFTAATRDLGMTQSGISQAVHALEEALGVALLARGRERVEATEIGQQVLVEARAALRAVDRIREHCANWAGLDRGSLRIGTVASAAARLLPDRLRAFRTRYPNVEITLLEGSDAEVREWTVRDAVDIGLTAEQAPELEGEVIAEDDFVVVVCRRLRRPAGRSMSVGELSRHPFIMSGAGCGPAIRTIFADAGREPQVAFTVRDMTALFAMVRQNLGLTIVPSLALPADLTDLRILELDPARRRKLLMVTRRGQRLAPAAVAFRDVLLQAPATTSVGRNRAAAVRSGARAARQAPKPASRAKL